MFSLTRERYHNIDANLKLSLVRFIFSLGTASAATVWSLYMHHIGFSNTTIGYVTGSIVLLSVLLSLISTPVLEFVGARRLFTLSLLLYSITYATIAFTTNKVLFVVLAGIIAVATVSRVEGFAILFRDTISRKNLAKREGLMFALANLGWFAAPAIAGLILVRYGFSSVFLVVASLFIVALAMLFLTDTHRTDKDRFARLDGNVLKNIRRFIARRELWYPYITRLGFNSLGGFILIYLPVFIVERGGSPVLIGAALSIMSLLHALFDFKIGKATERRGFKSFLVFGFMASATLLVGASFLLQSGYVFLVALIPLMGAMTVFIEPIQDTFFFSLVSDPEDEERLYPIYSTANQMGGFTGKALTATVLLFASEQFAFLFMASVMVLVALVLVSFKDKTTHFTQN